MDAPPSTIPAPTGTAAPHRAATPPALRTVGVEEELLLVDPRTGRVRPVAATALAADAALGAPALTPELQQEQVETATPPRASMADVDADLRALRDRAQAAARAAGVLAVPLATSPLPARPSLSPGDRYRAISDSFGVTCAQQLTCGCHVHVAVDSPDEGVAVLDRIRSWLPLLTAVATNSPFADGQDTGYAGYRTQAWGRWPATGPVDLYGSVERYHARVQQLLDTGVLLDAGMFYADARLSHRYPTVEVRVADVCLDPADTVLVAALARALVVTAADEWRAGEPPLPTETAVLRLAAWRASRDGVEGDLLHPVTGRPVAAPLAVQALLDHVGPALAAAGDAALVERRLEHVLARGTGATWQRAVAAATGDLAEVVLRSAV
ncbi:carboxylate-amine ligase [Cellulomonas pakistanensis]|uniref:Putative glutamate--cysteine ligase 2 n=1 Tax=Cellulomonas pakistanensis TaxID=992287 RepID=A0A919PEA8_9CELL|nr:glutamate--cysteine ligase [Cellulomonas pakistanensis]GIG38223.1 putative glutamate--cysteine ligase 2 [Cellulomonas pakistanensis]